MYFYGHPGTVVFFNGSRRQIEPRQRSKGLHEKPGPLRSGSDSATRSLRASENRRFTGFAQISSEFRTRRFERSQFHRQAILINGLQEALAQFAMNFHRRANHGIGLRILLHKICGNRRKSGAPAPPTQTNELKGVHHAN